MPLVRLMKASIILPRKEAAEAINRLAELEWFHPINKESSYTNPDIDDLLLDASRLLQSIEEIVKSLNIQLETGILDTMFKGALKVSNKFVISDIQDLINEVDSKSRSIIDEAKSLLNEYNRIGKSLEENKSIREVLRAASSISVDISSARNLKRFFVSLFIVDQKDVAEIERSLPDVSIAKVGSTELNTALLVISSKEDEDRVVKVFRSYDVHPFVIPPALPQNPSEAYAYVEKSIAECTAKKMEMEDAIERFKERVTPTVVSLYEGARTAKDILETMRKPYGTKYFALIEGYIPAEMTKRFESLVSKWVYFIEGVDEDNPESPTLVKNAKYMRTGHNITAGDTK